MEVPRFGWQRSTLRAFCEISLAGPAPWRKVELQRLERAGTVGHALVLYRDDGGLDVAFDEPLGLDERWARRDPAMAHLPVRRLAPLRPGRVSCDVSGDAVLARADVADVFGHALAVRVEATGLPIPPPSFVPAPPLVGGGARPTRCDSLRFMLIDALHLLPRRAAASVAIDGSARAVRGFGLPGAVAPFRAVRAGGQLLLGSLLGGGEALGGGLGRLDEAGARLSDAHRWMGVRGLERVADAPEGRFAVASSLGELASGRWRRTDAGGIELDDLRQDWRDARVSVAGTATRWARRYRRRGQTILLESARSQA